MKSITIAGNIGKDAETRTTQGGDSVTSFPVAVSNGKDAPATWFQVSLWGKRGQSLKQYLTKGSKICVSGEMSTREHDGKTYIQVRADLVSLMGGGEKRDSAPAQGASSGGGYSGDLDDEIPF